MGVWPLKPGCPDNLIDVEDKGVAVRLVGGLGGTNFDDDRIKLFSE